MQLGKFSVSLNVENLQASISFYVSLGFEVIGGDEEQGWTILKNGESTIGLFQGMFEGNILTFNPGWDVNGEALEAFTDIRDLQKKLKREGVRLDSEVEENSTGPASFMLKDPDGNQIMVDQHV